jgi:hypothetical protein
MRRIALRATGMTAMLAVATLLAGTAHAQARGPSLQQIRQSTPHIYSAVDRRQQQWFEAQIRTGQRIEREDRERAALLDPAYRARKFADLQDFIRIMPGRYRIESQVGYVTRVTVPYVSGTYSMGPVEIGQTTIVSGYAECVHLEKDADVRCRFRPDVMPVDDGVQRFNTVDMTDLMRPAMLWFTLDPEQPQLRTTLLAEGANAQVLVGAMDGGVISAQGAGICRVVTCFRTLDASAAKDAEQISLVFRTGNFMVTLTLHRVSAPLYENVLRPQSALLSIPDFTD